MNEVEKNEIDIFDFIETLWNGKWIVIGIVVISLLGVFGYLLTQDEKFYATTEIKSISSKESQKYALSNSVGFFEVSSQMLLDAYIEKLKERDLFEEAIDKFSLVNASEYKEAVAYEEAVVMLAKSIEIIAPDLDNTKNVEEGQWTINFEFNNKDKWKEVLLFVDKAVQNSVREFFFESFQSSLIIAKQLEEFELEDIETKIENAMYNYETRISYQLEYLREQAAIARKLEVANNTIEAQTFGGQDGILASVETDPPFYLRGYDAIEKEIELIENRENKKAFVSGLVDLELKKRKILQDQRLERAESQFALVPISTLNNFKAVSVNIAATEYQSMSKQNIIFALTIVISGTIGAFYVLISNAMRRREK